MPTAPYIIIWKHFEEDSEIGEHLEAEYAFSLPYFIDGIDKENFENHRPTDLHMLHLIKGLLVGYFDKPPGIDTSFAKQKAEQILDEHLETFEADSLESLILDFAAYLREHNGNEASLQALMTGVEIAPASNHIKYDCCLDLYFCLEDDVVDERAIGIQKLKLLLNEIDTSEFDAELLEDFEILKEETLELE